VEVIIGCGFGKKDVVTPAADLYTSAYHVTCRRWAASINARVWILSAKHGLILGTKPIAPYSCTFAPHPTHGFAADTGPLEPRITARALRATVMVSGIKRAVLLAGKDYEEALEEAAGDILSFRAPFRDLAIQRFNNGRRGYQQQLMIEYAGRIPR